MDGLRSPRVALDYPWSTPPAAGTAQVVAPGVRWLRMPLPFALEHINLWLLGEAGLAAVDCGYGTAATRSAWHSVLDACAPAQLTRIVVTHYHPDHVGLASWLAETARVPVYMTESEYSMARAAYERTDGTQRSALRAFHGIHGLSGERFDELAWRDDHYRIGVPALPQGIEVIRDGELLDLGGQQWEVIVGTGHSPQHAALYCAALGVLISGDMLLPRISTNVSVWPMDPDEDPLTGFLTSLERFEALPPDTLVLPSHGLPFRGMHQRIAELRAHHDFRLDRLARACATPRAAAELLSTLFSRQFDDYQLLFAMGEAVAHLNHLMHRGVLDRSADAAGVCRFERRATH